MTRTNALFQIPGPVVPVDDGHHLSVKEIEGNQAFFTAYATALLSCVHSAVDIGSDAYL